MRPIWSIAWIIVTGETRGTRRKSVSQCHCIHPTNPTKTSPVHKPGRRSETPAPNRLSHGTDKTKVHASALDYMEVGWSTSHSGSFTPEERDPYPLHGKQNCPQSWFGQRTYLYRKCNRDCPSHGHWALLIQGSAEHCESLAYMKHRVLHDINTSTIISAA